MRKQKIEKDLRFYASIPEERLKLSQQKIGIMGIFVVLQIINSRLTARWVINFNIKKDLQMSRCHFPHENRTIILDIPSLSNINTTMLLIETNKNIISYTSALSLTCFQNNFQINDQISEEDSLGLQIQEESFKETEQIERKKNFSKNGCTCKKTNCLKMYCQCFSTGKMCSPECVCYGCYNQSGYEDHIQVVKDQLRMKVNATNRHINRTCNCKKSQCQKKYCQCFNAGMPCTEQCNCIECYNKQNDDLCYKIHTEQNSSGQEVNQ